MTATPQEGPDLDDPTLFWVDPPPPITLADRFQVPPLSVLDRRQGVWQDRRRRWLTMGFESEVGRGDALTYRKAKDENDFMGVLFEGLGPTSLFDPVLCELAYRWHTPPGARILDPFAGGSVRGLVASTLARHYLGIELSHEQVDANLAQAHLGTDIRPSWIQGDSASMLGSLGGDFDMLFSCPPYADLEVYSDDPSDLSAMPYPAFLAAYRGIIRQALAQLRPHRFAVWVVSDVRDKRSGAYRGLVAETIRAFTDGGASLHNDAVILDPVSSVALRAARPFIATRKLGRCHQHMLIFVKGDARQAAAYAGGGLVTVLRRCRNVERIAPRWGGGHMCTGPCGHPHLHGRHWQKVWRWDLPTLSARPMTTIHIWDIPLCVCGHHMDAHHITPSGKYTWCGVSTPQRCVCLNYQPQEPDAIPADV